MRSLHFLGAIGLSLIAGSGALRATPGTRFRDLVKKDQPEVCEKMRALLEVGHLSKTPGKPVLQIWNELASVTFTVSGDVVTVRVIRGVGAAWYSFTDIGKWEKIGPIPNAENLLEVKKTEFTYADAAFAENMRYLISQATRFDSNTWGADGGGGFLRRRGCRWKIQHLRSVVSR
jgi:hypothetical protein